MIDPADIGERVLAELEAGRAGQLKVRLQRARDLRELIVRADRLERATGRPLRGRAGRIARRLQLDGVKVTERRVAQILSEMVSDIADRMPASAVG